jgi:Protein of unknown function (DUF4239)
MGGFGVLGLWVMLVIVLVLSIVVALVSVWASNRVMSVRVGTEHNPTFSPFLTVVGLVFGALLGFTVVVAWEQFSSAEANVAHEASTLTTMYRQTVGIPDPLKTQLREQLRKYTEAVEGPEWAAQQSGGGTSDNARAAITEMYRLLGNQPTAASTPIAGEFLKELTVLATDRNQRALDAEPRIPPLLWTGLLFGAVLLVALTGFMRLESNVGHVILSSAIALLLGVLLFIIYWLDHPFGAEIGVTPAPFRHALEVFDITDQGK